MAVSSFVPASLPDRESRSWSAPEEEQAVALSEQDEIGNRATSIKRRSSRRACSGNAGLDASIITAQWPASNIHAGTPQCVPSGSTTVKPDVFPLEKGPMTGSSWPKSGWCRYQTR
jgi:hypothetical protein